MTDPFLDMPRMNALYERLKSDGIITESSKPRSRKGSGKAGEKTGDIRDKPKDRDTKGNTA